MCCIFSCTEQDNVTIYCKEEMDAQWAAVKQVWKNAPEATWAVKTDDATAQQQHVPQWLSMFNPDFDAARQHSFANLGMSGNLDDL